MALSAGEKLGPYEVFALIGKGGMGEVYRAHDSRLNRDVAIKVSVEHFGGRFEREARVIAALNHPHICILYDVGPNYLVMELCDGETLAAGVKHGKLSVVDTLRYGQQIADALAAAHAKGITHRDLKPANIMIAKSGVKVLDFGVAKFSDPGVTVTQAGALIGTPAYMAPEQTEGKDADARTDIYALGLVLYEMATGKRAVHGQTPHTADLPAQLAHVIERCLAQDPDARWQSARDVKAELQWAGVETSQPAGLQKSRGSRRWLAAAAILAAAVGVAVGLIAGRAREPYASAQPFSFRIPIPEGLRMIGRSSFSISPDGKMLAFMAARSDGIEHVWVQRIGELEAKLLPDTQSRSQSAPPFWSPDSKTLVFSSLGKLKKIDLNGGTPQAICDVSTIGSGGSWSRDGVIIFGDLTSGVMRVPAAGGIPTSLTALGRGERVHTHPVFLPDARHFLYVKGGSDDVHGVYIGSIDAEPSKQDPKRLLATPYSAQIVPLSDAKAKLLYFRDGTVMARDFDTAKLQLAGEPVTVAERVGNSLIFGFYAASPSTLAYRTVVRENIQLQWFDRQGKPGPAVGEPMTRDASLALSPDGRQALVHRSHRQNSNIWLLDLHRDVFLRLTTSFSIDSTPIWSPDTKRFAFSSSRMGNQDIFQAIVGSETREELLLQTSVAKYPLSWSADERFLLYVARGGATKDDLWVLPLDQGKPGTPFPFAATPASESEGQFSPDGRWIAYTSDETGSPEVFVRSFAPPANPGAAAVTSQAAGLKTLVSTAGGIQPHWRKDGKELFYVASTGVLMAVPVGLGNSFQAGVPQALFPIASPRMWDVAADGNRFLVGVPLEQGGQVPFTVVQNWMAGWKR